MDNKNGYKNSPVGWIPVEWEVKPINSFGKVQTGSTPPTDDLENYGTDFLFVSPADLDNSKYILKTSKRLSAKGFAKSRTFPKGSILVTCIGSTIGKMGMAGLDLTSNQQINAVTINKENDNEYLFYELSRHVKKIRNLAGEQAVPIVNKSTFESFLIAKPPLPEQRAIAAVLRACDETLEKNQALLAALRRRHAGLMQALLSGKKRVKGFEGEKWENLEIQEIGEVIRGASPRPQGDPRFFGGTVPRLMVEDVTRDGKFVTPKVDFLTEEGAKKSRPCKKGTLTVVCSGTVGVPSILAVDACIHDGFLAIINLKDNIALEFLYYQLFQVKEKMERSATHGGVFTNLTTSILKEFKILFPSLPEQRAITTILQASEAEIRGYERQAALLQRQKKGLMQVLLTGRVRVKNAVE